MGEIQYHVQKQNRENKPRNIPDRKKELEYFFNILVIFPSASISVILLHSPDCIPSSKSVSSPNFILFTSGDDRLVIILVTKRGTVFETNVVCHVRWSIDERAKQPPMTNCKLDVKLKSHFV